ncbi:MAG: hypothetical protein ACYSUI_17605, partial [Planctomycetota bacterium]
MTTRQKVRTDVQNFDETRRALATLERRINALDGGNIASGAVSVEFGGTGADLSGLANDEVPSMNTSTGVLQSTSVFAGASALTASHADLTSYLSLSHGTDPYILTAKGLDIRMQDNSADTTLALTNAQAGNVAHLDVEGTATADQLVSEVATGAAPLTVASTTVVTNL